MYLFKLGDDTTQSTEKDESGAHISSPIRVSPDRKRPRVKSSPRHKDHGKDKKLSVKERLYVSKNTIGLYCTYMYMCTNYSNTLQ